MGDRKAVALAEDIHRRLANTFERMVSEAAGAALLEMLSSVRPDAVVMDIQMPIMDGLVACSTIRRDFPAIPVVLVTGHMNDGLDEAARDAGAAAFVYKHRLVLDLRPAVRAALSTVSRAINETH